MTSAHVYIRKQAHNIIDEKKQFIQYIQAAMSKKRPFVQVPATFDVKNIVLPNWRQVPPWPRVAESTTERDCSESVSGWRTTSTVLCHGGLSVCLSVRVVLGVTRAPSRVAQPHSLCVNLEGCAYGLCDHSYPFFDLSGRGFVPQRREEWRRCTVKSSSL